MRTHKYVNENGEFIFVQCVMEVDMETRIMDGQAIARELRGELKEKIQSYMEKGLPAPKMAVILVGEDPASQVYVANKEKACKWVHMESVTYRMPESTTEEELLQVVSQLNDDSTVNGILVQLPLPKHLDAEPILKAIAPEKDVDGFHVVNTGKLFTGQKDAYISCTPAGIVQMLKRSGIEIEGKHCVIAGRSNIVGKPLALLMLQENATVTVCHSKTENITDLTRQADIFVAAVGRPRMFGADAIKEGAVVVDVGIHRTESGLCGDVDYEAMLGKAVAITPVPGGVGPMTIAMLLYNCVQAFERQYQIEQ